MLFILRSYPSEYMLQAATGVLFAVLIGMTVHEFAHNYIAHLMGDPTPREQGRLTLNPSVHIYMPGFIMFLLIGFGPLGMAPINPYRMRNPRWGNLAAVAAGPISNLLLAIVFAIIMHVTGLAVPRFSANIQIGLWIILRTIVFFNLLLFVFNLLPFFPLDGWHIVYSLLPPDMADWWSRNRQMTSYAFFACLLLSFVSLPGIPSPFGILVGEPVSALMNLLGVL